MQQEHYPLHKKNFLFLSERKTFFLRAKMTWLRSVRRFFLCLVFCS